VPSTLNEFPLLGGTIRVPRIGAWSAEVEFREETAYTGTALLTVEGIEFSGYCRRSALKGSSRVSGLVIGGAGGLDTALPAKQYVAPKVESVLADIMRPSGETLSATVSSSVTGRTLTTWQRAEGTAQEAISALAEALGMPWRVLLDGTIWIGAETWAEATPEHRTLSDDQATGTVTVSLLPSLLPGATFQGLQLEQVTHVLDPAEPRTEASQTSPAAALAAFLGPAEKRIRYSRSYSARVVKQNGDGTLQVLPDDAQFKGSGVDQVKIRLGVPGTATVPKGARVELQFEGGDPQKPIATAFFNGELTELNLGSGADFVALAQLVLGELNQIKTDYDLHTHPTGMGPSGPPAVPLTQPQSVAASKVKAE
jgi:hypothetical protein